MTSVIDRARHGAAMRPKWFLLMALAVSAPSAHGATTSGAEGFSFAVLADVPYSTREEPVVADVLRSIGAGDDRFVVHLGDIKGPAELCSDELFEIRRTLLDSSPKPLVLLPGGLDWSACSAPESGGYDPDERLTHLRETLFATDQSLGEQTMLIARQSGVKRFRPFSENIRWQAGEVLFVGLNLPAPNNDFRYAGGRNVEFEDRSVALRAWLERAFAYAQTQHLAAVVVLCEGDPMMARSTRLMEGRGPRRDGFFEFKNTLRDLTARFHGQVLLVHGSSADPDAGGWVADASGKAPRNFWEARAFGSPHSGRWIEIRVDVRRPRPFTIIAQGLTPSKGVPLEPPH